MSELTRVYFGHHKCASQYIKSILVQSAHLMGWSVKTDSLPFVLPDNYHLREPFASRLQQKRQMLASTAFDLICLENADNESVAILSEHLPLRGVHVIRDPRDIVVSGYFSHLYSHPASAEHSPWLWEHRQRLQSLSHLEEGLMAEIEYCATYFERLRAWDYSNSNIWELRYENLILDPEQAFTQAFAFLGISLPGLALLPAAVMAGEFWLSKFLKTRVRRRAFLPKPLLRAILWQNSFQHRSEGRRAGEENLKHHYRKGIPGDWRNYFTPRVKEAFKHNYPQLVETLGYELDEDW